MTLAMPDSVTVASLPPGYDAYLGYCDGDYPTGPELVRLFPEAHQVILTVTGRTTSGCNGADIENGDLSVTGGVLWAIGKEISKPGCRPVIYASVSVMAGVVEVIKGYVFDRAKVRLLSAHFTDTPHICGPGSCGEVEVAMDGTQWTSSYRTAAGALVDMSMLLDDFFTPGGKP
jgi:hypothetical protein